MGSITVNTQETIVPTLTESPDFPPEETFRIQTVDLDGPPLEISLSWGSDLFAPLNQMLFPASQIETLVEFLEQFLIEREETSHAA